MTINLYLIRDCLTDGSVAHGVRVSVPGESHLDLDCLDEPNADSLRASLFDVFRRYRLDPFMVFAEVHKVAGWEV